VTGIPPLKPDRIEPLEPPGIEPLPGEPDEPHRPKTEPAPPDRYEPGTSPEEIPVQPGEDDERPLQIA